jgi:transposase
MKNKDYVEKPTINGISAIERRYYLFKDIFEKISEANEIYKKHNLPINITLNYITEEENRFRENSILFNDEQVTDSLWILKGVVEESGFGKVI